VENINLVIAPEILAVEGEDVGEDMNDCCCHQSSVVDFGAFDLIVHHESLPYGVESRCISQ
jgi:hypothetical protein